MKPIACLEMTTWFGKGGWIASVHAFPAAKPDGVTFHVFKKNWFNEDGRGIHVESYLDLKPFTDRAIPLVKKWPGYKLRAGKYGQQPFTCFLDGDSPDFSGELAAEVTRICRELGPEIDRVL
ncbi:MAG: hypothetical protein ABL958_07165 [Bdellovibrionia bacterium]